MSESVATGRSTKRSAAITILIFTNICLLAALLSECFSLPIANAQPGGRGGEYLSVTAKPAGQTYDVLYVLDPSAHRLHAFYPGLPQNKQLMHAEARDLKKDFNK